MAADGLLAGDTLVNAELRLDAKINPDEMAKLLAHDQLRPPGFGAVSKERIMAALASMDTGLVVCRMGEVPCGYFGIRWLNGITVAMMGGFVEPVRGKIARQFVKMFFDLIFSTGVLKVVGEVSSKNRACMMMIGTFGGKREGVNRASLLDGGEVVDQIYFGLTRREYLGKKDMPQ